MPLLAGFLAVLVTFVVIDLIWLGVVARGFYREALGELLAPKFRLDAAIAFYLIFATGLTWFAVEPSLAHGSVVRAAATGAALGFLCYATYDLTNLATLKGWPLGMSLVDMAWGSILSGLAAGAGALAARAAS